MRCTLSLLAKTVGVVLLALCLVGCTEYSDYYGESAQDNGPGSLGDGQHDRGADSRWGELRSLGPEQGAINALAADDTFLYAGAADGAIMFAPLNTEQGRWFTLGTLPQAVRSLVITPAEDTTLVSVDQTSGTLLYRLDELGQYVASDQGMTDGGPVLRLALDADEVLWALTPRMLYLSRDDGYSWQPVLNVGDVECASLMFLAAHPTQAGVALVVAACGEQPTVLRTLNYGRFWNKLDLDAPTGEEAWCIAASPADDQRLVAAGRRGVWTSGDMGENWALERTPEQWVLHLDVAFGGAHDRPVFVGLEAVHYRLMLLLGTADGSAWLRKIYDNVEPGTCVLCPPAAPHGRCFVGTDGGGVFYLTP